ncbi:hypothetical protein B6U91_00160 [Candidatus Pacearchaeota archaeon ex4484_71]|nr:MAG: hypothetical protein B6U91_00160 [Candidatus Pacearchaeota archaeon ex4484_71]
MTEIEGENSVPAEEFFSEKKTRRLRDSTRRESSFILNEDSKKKLKEIAKRNTGSKKAVIVNSELNELKTVGVRSLGNEIKRSRSKIAAVVIDGSATKNILNLSEERGIGVIVAKNFATTDTKVKLLSF